MNIRPLITIASLTAAAILAGCGIGGVDPASEPPVTGTEVLVVDNRFEPAHLEVATGEAVTWIWNGRAPHDVVGDDFDSGVRDDGTFTHAFDEPGVHDYECSLHRGMAGRITVIDR